MEVQSSTVQQQEQRRRFERLYAAHFDRIAAYLLARADREAASEALTATFEVAWRRINDVPRDELPWLLGVARRVLANDRRSLNRQAALMERIAAAFELTNDDDDIDSGLTADLAAALMGLTSPQREALLLIAWEGLSEHEAARALGCSRVAFAARLHRARSQIRRVIGDRDRHSLARGPIQIRTKNCREEPT